MLVKTIRQLSKSEFSKSKFSKSRAIDNQKRNFIKVIDQATVAYRERLGSNRIKLEPGLRLNLPFFHNLHWVDMKEGQINLKEIYAYTQDATPVTITGSLFYQVFDAEKACFQVQHYLQSTESVGTSAIRSMIGQFKWAEINSKRNEINSKLVEVLGITLTPWGIGCTKFEIQSIVPQNESVKRSLEQSIQAEQDKRRTELETQAKVIIAKGQQQIDITLSEGKKLAQQNSADGEYYEKCKQADANQYHINTTTEALKIQIEKIKEAMGGNVQLASEYLVEQQKLKHLQNLAKTNTNSLYFYPEGNLLPSLKIAGDLFNSSN